MGHKDTIEIMVKDRRPDILGVSETWFSPNMQDCYVSIPNNNIYRKDSGRGGGIGIYVRNTILISRTTPNVDSCPEVEDLWLKVQIRKLPMIILSVIPSPCCSSKLF